MLREGHRNPSGYRIFVHFQLQYLLPAQLEFLILLELIDHKLGLLFHFFYVFDLCFHLDFECHLVFQDKTRHHI